MGQSDLFKKSGLGQILMVGIEGTCLDDFTVKLIRECGVNKFILFSRNAEEGIVALQHMCAGLRQICREEGLDALIAIDQEGGPVRRLAPPLYPDMPSQEDVLEADEPLMVLDAMIKACTALLSSIPIDINLAPVLDLPLDAASHVLAGRCLGRNMDEIAERGAYYVKSMQAQGIACVAKHFPGIGRVRLDPHLALPLLSADLDTLMKEALPFRKAIQEGVAGIMTSHVVYEIIGNEPATFSKELCTKMLRDEFAFEGPLFSDDLEMKGILEGVSMEQVAPRAFGAGHDILLICKEKENIKKALVGLADAFVKGRITSDRIEEAIDRQGHLRIVHR